MSVENRAYKISMWTGGIVPPLSLDDRIVHYQGNPVDLSPYDIVYLQDQYDVMIQGPRYKNIGTKKNPEVVKIEPCIYLDERGGRFKIR